MTKKKPAILTLKQFRARKRILTTQKAISTFIEKEMGVDYDPKHPYFRLHVYPGPSFIVETQKGGFYCEIENTSGYQPLRELEEKLFKWASPLEA